MRTVTETFAVYSAQEMHDLFPAAFEVLIDRQISVLEDEWFEFVEREAASSHLETLGQPGLQVSECDLTYGILNLAGNMVPAEEFRVLRALANDPVETIRVGHFRDWTGWRFHVSDEQTCLTETEGRFLQCQKSDLERKLLMLLAEERSAYTSRSNALENLLSGETEYRSPGEAHWD